MRAFFDYLQVGALDAWTLFMSLDKDGDHTITAEEFTERCVQLHGPARSADLYAMKMSTVKLGQQVKQIRDAQERIESYVLLGMRLRRLSGLLEALQGRRAHDFTIFHPGCMARTSRGRPASAFRSRVSQRRRRMGVHGACCRGSFLVLLVFLPHAQTA